MKLKDIIKMVLKTKGLENKIVVIKAITMMLELEIAILELSE